MAKPASVRIIIVEHTAAYRSILKAVLAGIDGVSAVGTAADITTALKMVRTQSPDLILLDYEMLGADAHRTVYEFKRISPSLEVILISAAHRTETRSSMKALDLGALYFIRKPEGNSFEENVQYLTKYLVPAINMFRVNRSTHQIKKMIPKRTPKTFRKPPSDPLKVKIFDNFDILAIGSSLGGPEALYQLIPRLPTDFPLPIVIVQHMPGGFTNMLGNNLDEKSKLIVMEANGGERLRPGYVYIARGGKHLKIVSRPSGMGNQYITFLDDGPLENGCKPAVDVLFRSLARTVTGNILIVILTGMGNDGMKGLKMMKEKGNCFCITQSEESCVVYGMPAAADAAGLSDLSLPLRSLAKNLITIASGKINTVKSH